jgi:hypothetical protein
VKLKQGVLYLLDFAIFYAVWSTWSSIAVKKAAVFVQNSQFASLQKRSTRIVTTLPSLSTFWSVNIHDW